MVESIFEIIRSGSLNDLKNVVDRTNINIVNKEKQNPLHEAIAFNRDSFSEYLISLGIDINHQDNNGQTPLHFASSHNNEFVVGTLLRAGAIPTVKDKYGNDPLWTAGFNARGNYSIIKLFQGRGANPLNKNKAGISPIDFAAQIGDSELLTLLKNL